MMVPHMTATMFAVLIVCTSIFGTTIGYTGLILCGPNSLITYLGLAIAGTAVIVGLIVGVQMVVALYKQERGKQ